MDILVNVVNQKLKIATNLKNLVAGSQEFVRFVFNLNGDWDNLTTFAQFTQNGTSYNQYLDSNNSVYLPSEIGVGFCTLMLYGSHGNTIATTNFLTLTIDRNILVSNAQSTEISTSLYNQLVTRVNDLLAWASENPSDVAVADLQANVVRYDEQTGKTTAQKLQARTNIGATRQTMIAPLFSSTATYTVGKYVIYNDNFYRCKVAVETAGEWTGSANWAGPYTIGSEMNTFVSCAYNQNIVSGNQAIARNNIGAASASDLNTLSSSHSTLQSSVVKHTSNQGLTAEQKTNARNNIGTHGVMIILASVSVPTVNHVAASISLQSFSSTPIVGDTVYGSNGYIATVTSVSTNATVEGTGQRWNGYTDLTSEYEEEAQEWDSHTWQSPIEWLNNRAYSSPGPLPSDGITRHWVVFMDDGESYAYYCDVQKTEIGMPGSGDPWIKEEVVLMTITEISNQSGTEDDIEVTTYRYIDSELSEKVTRYGLTNQYTKFITPLSVPTPTNSGDAANKGYVDGYAVAKDQGSANAGKFLVVGNNGTVGLLDISNASGVSF